MNDDIDAVVLPFNALGGSAALSFIQQKKLVIAVEENKTTMDITPCNEIMKKYNNIVLVKSYFEAAGLIAAHRNGILFESIRPNIATIPLTEM